MSSQIEEIANTILRAGDNYDTTCREDCETIASLIYAEGFRKTPEAKWVESNPNLRTIDSIDVMGNETYITPDHCSNCGHKSKDLGNYCSNCGAIMKE